MAASRRAFHYALLASIALHLALLFAFPDWMETARRVVESPPPIIARLLAPEPAAPPPAPAPSVEAKPRPAPKAAREREVVATPAPSPIPAPAPVPAPPPPVASLPPAATTAPAQAPAAPKVDDSAQTTDQYRLQLIDAARRIKDRTRYPPQAWENHWEGDVVLGIALRPDGRHAVVVNRSSRYEVLDQQAVQILSQALREVPLPAPLRGKDVALRDVTVQYRQRD